MSQNRSGRRTPTPAIAAASATRDNTPAAAKPATSDTAAAGEATSASSAAQSSSTATQTAASAAISTSSAAQSASTAAGSASEAASLAASAAMRSEQALTVAQEAMAIAQHATSGVSIAAPADDDGFDPDEIVPVRVLVAHDGHRCNDVLRMRADEARAARKAGWGDPHPAAIAAARA